MPSNRARMAASFFDVNGRAGRYESRTGRTNLWKRETVMVAAALDDLPRGSTVLDVPVGTGRFLPLYRDRGFVVTGIDSSRDMIAEARRKNIAADLRKGTIFQIDAKARSFDVVVTIRLMHLIERGDYLLAMAEMKRVSRRRIVFSIRLDEMGDPAAGVYQVKDIASRGWRRSVEVIDGDWHLVVMDRC